MSEKTHTWYPIIRKEEIPIGSSWFAADGSGHTVVVTAVDLDSPAGWVKYEWVEKPSGVTRSHEKSSFAFQCRYCLPSRGVTQVIPADE